MSLPRSRTRRTLQRAGLALFTLVLAWAVVEVLMRLWLPDAYHVWPPYFQKVSRLDPGFVQGIEGASHLTINSFGVRGDELDDRNAYRILAFGGSTTICAYLDDAEVWTHLAQGSLNRELGPHAVWFGNAGRAGHTTIQHVVQVEKLLAQHPEIDAAVLLVGINDLLVTLSLRRGGRPAKEKLLRSARSEDADLRHAFARYPGWDEDAPWWRRTWVARLGFVLSGSAPGTGDEFPEQDARGAFVAESRAYRRQASAFIEELPDLSGALASYAKQLRAIVDTARAHGVRPVFLTQPALWRAGLPAEEEALLWTGGPPLDALGPRARYYATEALASGMQLYNEKLLEVCRERGVECWDAASHLPRDSTVFYDDAHYTEKGARLLADFVADSFLASPPLAGMRARRAP